MAARTSESSQAREPGIFEANAPGTRGTRFTLQAVLVLSSSKVGLTLKAGLMALLLGDGPDLASNLKDMSP